MSQCLTCLRNNPPNANFCQKCGSKLLLIERYRAIRSLGQGGFGRTFLAVDEKKPSQPKCVIKQFHPDTKYVKNIQKATELFVQEAEQLEKLGKHSQIPELFAYFTQDEQQYLVQEFIDGDDLQQELEEKGAYNEQQIRELLRDMLTVLQFVHSNNIIHRDIKPENIIRRRKDEKLVLVDFGAVKIEANPNLSVMGTMIGDPRYSAPEQVARKAKFASDLYSLGATCLYLLTQVDPTDLFSHHEDQWVWRDYLVNNPVSDELGIVLDKLVERAIKRRYQSVAEVLGALTNTSSQSQSPKKPNVPPPDQGNASVFSSYKNLKTDKFEVTTVSLTKEVKKRLLRKDEVTYKPTYTRKPGKSKYYTIDLGEGVVLDMVAIPRGTFTMGESKSNESGILHLMFESSSQAVPQHEVTVPPFFISRFPITRSQWQVIMGNFLTKLLSGNNNCPVDVPWLNAVKFCQKLTELTGKEYCLPSEAQWEYACRAGTTTKFHFGETLTDRLANYGKASSNKKSTMVVGKFPPNSFGLYDMHGNIKEWCADTWHDDYHGAPVDGSPWTSGGNDPTNTKRVVRGGGVTSLAFCCRSAYRTWSHQFLHNGFRVVCVTSGTL